jgi:hypothetical protein
MHCSLLNFNSFLPSGQQLSRISQNSLDKQQVAVTCRFSKAFCTNPRNISIDRMRGIALCCLQKSYENSKGFGVKQLRTSYFN